jgi:uncharacterized protein (DUF1697 family)
MPRLVALLRGVNLGPRNRVKMAELRELVEELGHEDVRTLLQSGNVVFTSDAAPDAVARELSEAIADRLGVRSDVIVRTRDELADVVARDPFGDEASDPKRYQVSFLSGEPDGAAARALSEGDFAPERVVVSGREVYAWHAEGIQNSALAKEIGKADLGVSATARNWNTVTKLLALADE